MSIADKLVAIAENEQRVYDAGKNTIWDVVLDGGKRTSAEYTFYYWNCEYIRPPFVWKPTTRTIYCFYRVANLKKIEKQYFDFSGTPENKTSTQGHYYTVYYCPDLEIFEDIGLPACDYEYTWASCNKLHTIELVRSTKATKYSNAFGQCYALSYIRFEGEIGQNIAFTRCYSLSVESVVDILQHLYNYSGTSDNGTKTITLDDKVKTLMANQGAMAELDGKTYDAYITGKGWNLA